MITCHQQSGGLYRYYCDVCKVLRLVRFANLRNPCKCHMQEIIHFDAKNVEVRRTFSVALIRMAPRDAEGGDPRHQLTEPTLLAKAANFTKAAARHVAAGRPLATDEQVAERFALCAACKLFKPQGPDAGVCTHPSCGCALKTVGLAGRNKLRWADSQCPLDEPRWLALPAPPAE